MCFRLKVLPGRVNTNHREVNTENESVSKMTEEINRKEEIKGNNLFVPFYFLCTFRVRNINKRLNLSYPVSVQSVSKNEKLFAC